MLGKVLVVGEGLAGSRKSSQSELLLLVLGLLAGGGGASKSSPLRRSVALGVGA